MANNDRLSTKELNSIFCKGLGENAVVSSSLSEKPLLIDLINPYKSKLRVYLFNCTNPPGGRALDEYKSQIIVPGQIRGKGERGNFDYSDDRIVILGGFANIGDTLENGVFVLWDALCHTNFSYSANIQIKSEAIMAAISTTVATYVKTSEEIVFTARVSNLLPALTQRIETASKLK